MVVKRIACRCKRTASNCTGVVHASGWVGTDLEVHGRDSTGDDIVVNIRLVVANNDNGGPWDVLLALHRRMKLAQPSSVVTGCTQHAHKGNAKEHPTVAWFSKTASHTLTITLTNRRAISDEVKVVMLRERASSTSVAEKMQPLQRAYRWNAYNVGSSNLTTG